MQIQLGSYVKSNDSKVVSLITLKSVVDIQKWQKFPRILDIA